MFVFFAEERGGKKSESEGSQRFNGGKIMRTVASLTKV